MNLRCAGPVNQIRRSDVHVKDLPLLGKRCAKLARIIGTIGTMASLGAALCLPASSAPPSTISIEVTPVRQQVFHGFGAMLANNCISWFLPAGGRADVPGSVASKVYDLIFNPNNPNSLNLTYFRTGMNADNYKMSPTANYDLYSALVKTGDADVLQAVKKRNPKIKIYVSIGTPPFWMKENGADYNAKDPTTWSVDAPTTNHLLATNQAAFAALVKSYCTNFQQYLGFPIDYLSLQNEPDTNVQYGCCIYPDSPAVDPKAATYAGVLKQLANQHLTTTKLWGPENTKCTDTSYFAQTAASGLVSNLATHDYGSTVADLPLNARHGLPVNMTETSFDEKSYKVNGTPNEAWMGGALANSFCKDVNDGQAASWFWLTCVGVNFPNSPEGTGENLIMASATSDPTSVYKYFDMSNIPTDHSLIALNNNKLYPASAGPYECQWKTDFGPDLVITSKYYVLRRLSQEITPGSVSLLTKTSPNYHAKTSGQDDVYSAAFKLPSGKLCLVIANQSTKTYAAALKVDQLTSFANSGFTVYYTSQDAAGKPVNDVSWTEDLQHGKNTTNIWPMSAYCYVQK
jgi:O-glycosyl hydrolase